MVEILKKYWVIILIGLILRLIVAGFTYHPDLRSQAMASYFYFQGNPNPYKASQQLSSRFVLDKLPMSYFIDLPFHAVGRIFIDPKVERAYFLNTSLYFGTPLFWLYLIYAKLPFIAFDIFLGIGLTLFVKLDYQKKVLTLWLFNPVAIWVSSAVGQIDVFATFSMVLALLFVKKQNLNLAALSLGFGGAVKFAPFLLFPLLLGLAKNWTQRFYLTILAIFPYILTAILYLPSQEFRQSALLAPQIDKVLYSVIPLSGGESVFIGPLLILVTYFIYLAKKRTLNDFVVYSLAVLSISLSFTHFHIQWFLWVVPFMILLFVNRFNGSNKLAVYGLIISLLMMLFMFDASLQVKLFAPLFPQLDKANGLAEILSNDQVTFVRSVAATIFMAASGFLIWHLFKTQDENNNSYS